MDLTWYVFAAHSQIEDFWQRPGKDWQPKELNNPEVVTALCRPEGSVCGQGTGMVPVQAAPAAPGDMRLCSPGWLPHAQLSLSSALPRLLLGALSLLARGGPTDASPAVDWRLGGPGSSAGLCLLHCGAGQPPSTMAKPQAHCQGSMDERFPLVRVSACI